MFSAKAFLLTFVIYAKIFISPIITEILLKPSNEFNGIIYDNSASSISNIINAITATTTTTTTTTTTAITTTAISIIINEIQTTTTISSSSSNSHLLDVNSDDNGKISSNFSYINKSIDSIDDTLSTIMLKSSSESKITNHISSKGAFFCRYQTIPYKTAKVRLYSNIARVHENK
ncbi:hypothetical protein LOAG_15416 [Loa loa]|uniref:Uncharacterized protein n=1 Tax=Loa loa TaxID=7209 RepID=A0A1S0TFX1_LOALO|nr:hypothetical protein LOAG_15416 [Loa loa]EFO13115.1 hypothetical protein LOAG_15416 [Loa loa]